MDISTSEITSTKVRGNNVDFSTINIISKKVRGNNVDFSTVETTSKKLRGFFDQPNYTEKLCGNDVEIRRNLAFNVST